MGLLPPAQMVQMSLERSWHPSCSRTHRPGLEAEEATGAAGELGQSQAPQQALSPQISDNLCEPHCRIALPSFISTPRALTRFPMAHPLESAQKREFWDMEFKVTHYKASVYKSR